MIKANSYIKLFFLIKIILIFFNFCLISYADDLSIKNNFVVIGSNDAPVKIKIFSSLTCPHCASFHINVLPEIKKKYVESGKVQLILIDFPLDQAAFNAAKLVNCTVHKKQIKFLDAMYENQSAWIAGASIHDINNNLKKIVENLGINSEQFKKCLNDEKISDMILNGRIDGHSKYNINSTPTVVINEKKLEGSVNFENIKKKIEKII